MLTRLFATALLVPVLVVPAPTRVSARRPVAAPAVWTLDKAHTSVSFQIRHFVSKVRGSFGNVTGTITGDPESWQNAQIEVTIPTATVNTGNERRDADLRSSNFFAADSFPEITFKSTRIERSGDDAKIHGTLTMRGVSRPVVLDGHLNGIQKTAQGDKLGFDATTTVNRMDYGVKWNRAVEGGGAMLSDEVKIEINVEANRAK